MYNNVGTFLFCFFFNNVGSNAFMLMTVEQCYKLLLMISNEDFNHYVHVVNVSLLPEDSCTKAWRNCSTDWSSTER